MLTITKPAPDRLDTELTGRLDAAGMEAALDDLVAKSEGIQHGRMLYRIPAFAMPTLGAIAVEFGRLPRLFGMIRRFDRCAVLSDAGWLRTAAEVEGAFIPGLAVKAFPLDAAAEAEAWLSR